MGKNTIIRLSVLTGTGIALLALSFLYSRGYPRHEGAMNALAEPSAGHKALQEMPAASTAALQGRSSLSDDAGKREQTVRDAVKPASLPAHGDPFKDLPEQVKAWLKLPLTPQAFADGLAFLGDQGLSEQTRILIMDKLHSWRRHLASNEIKLLFTAVERITSDTAQPATLRARAVNAMATLLVVMQEQNVLARANVEAYFPFLAQLSQDKEEVPAVRGGAIRALGILGAKNAGAMARAMLADSGNVNEPELARNACLTLAQVEGELAVEPLGKVLATTSEKSVFGTAAFALGQIHTVDSLAALVQNKDRFPDSGSPDAALVKMEDVILDVLQEPENPNILFAIEATRHLWKEGQRERYTPILRAVSAAAPVAVQRAAVERLIDDARSLTLEKEQEELTVILPIVSNNPALADCVQRIQERLNAKSLVPDAAHIPTVARPR